MLLSEAEFSKKSNQFLSGFNVMKKEKMNLDDVPGEGRKNIPGNPLQQHESISLYQAAFSPKEERKYLPCFTLLSQEAHMARTF